MGGPTNGVNKLCLAIAPRLRGLAEEGPGASSGAAGHVLCDSAPGISGAAEMQRWISSREPEREIVLVTDARCWVVPVFLGVHPTGSWILRHQRCCLGPKEALPWIPGESLRSLLPTSNTPTPFAVGEHLGNPRIGHN